MLEYLIFINFYSPSALTSKYQCDFTTDIDDLYGDFLIYSLQILCGSYIVVQ